jgi:DNA-binding beta-propeller fold protein YncE
MKARLALFCLTLVIGLVMAGCKSSPSTTTIAVSPTSATVLLGTSFQFLSSASGSNNAVQWSVNGVPNGNASFGMISPTGLYTAPASRLPALGVIVPVVFAVANAALPNSGSTGSVIELQSGFNMKDFAPGNTINISGNSQPGWNSSFIIQAAAVLSNGQFGVQIATPPGPPPNGVGGTATATPNITISAQVTGTSAIANATVSLDSGVRVSLSQPTCTIYTNETFTFTASVSGNTNQAVTWSVSGVGTITPTGLNTALYAALATTGTATVTATSAFDPTQSASATVTVAPAADPTVTALSPTTGALGATRQDVYLSGSNFICTTAVIVNNGATNIFLPASSLFALSSTTFLVSVPDSILSTLPTSGTTTTLTFSAERQGSTTAVSCSSCQLVLSPVRPALVAATPDSIALPTGTFNLTLDGGYFGTTNVTIDANNKPIQGKPLVNVQFNGQSNGTLTFNSDRQLTLAVPASDASAPGLYPINVANTVSCPPSGTPVCGTGSPNGSMASANLAVQPTAVPKQVGPPPSGVVGVVTVGAIGTNPIPTAVAINTATGVAVVANRGTNDITLVNLGSLATPSLSILTPSLCTGSIGTSAAPCGVATGPTSVAVDNIRNLALVANSGNSMLAVVDLGNPSGTPPVPPKVTALLSFQAVDSSGNPLLLAPQAVGINPVTGRALVAFSTSSGAGGSNAGAILDMDQVKAATNVVALPAPGAAPILLNVVNINNGPQPQIAVSAKLNWALATPGGTGSLSIVDLGRQTTNQITSLSCSGGVVTANVSIIPSLQPGQPVLITGASPSSLNGIFQVRSVSNTNFTYSQASCASGSGGTAAYAVPVATLATNPNVRGVSINDETQKALLVDPTNTVPAFVFNILDQSSPAVSNLPSGSNNVATAMNPLTNVGVIVNRTGNQGLVVNPVTPTVVPGLSFTTGNVPVDVAIDPAANTALVVNQGDNTVSLFSLGGPLRSSPQIVQGSFVSAGSTQSSTNVTIKSSLGSAAMPQNQTVTLVGNFPGTPVPRLDGNCSSALIGLPTITNGGRMLTATISGSFLTANGPRLYALDVVDSCTTPTSFSNTAPLQVIQAVTLKTTDCSSPAPQGVAIDAAHNAAVVTEPGCNHVSLVSLAPTTIGQGVFGATDLAVGTNPQGVAVYPQAGLAVAANASSNNVSIVDIVNNAVPTTFTVDPIPTGVAIDLGLGKATVTANGASLVDVFPVSTTSQTPTTVGVQQGPTAVAIDQKDHVAVVANSNSNTASVVNLSTNTVSLTSSISFPQGVAFDPITGAFLVTSAASNQVIALNPNTSATLGIRVGIGPSSVAYNFESGTLVTANNLSGTVSVVDFIDQTVRGVFSLPSSTQFAIDIHPQTNLAVVADTADNEVLLVPLPH